MATEMMSGSEEWKELEKELAELDHPGHQLHYLKGEYLIACRERDEARALAEEYVGYWEWEYDKRSEARDKNEWMKREQWKG